MFSSFVHSSHVFSGDVSHGSTVAQGHGELAEFLPDARREVDRQGG